MSGWTDSGRRARLPSDWHSLRQRILRRDKFKCQALMLDGRICGDMATDVDHVKAGDDHGDWNLQSLCSWHHKKKSAKEGSAASAAKRKEVDSRFQRNESHPGAI